MSLTNGAYFQAFNPFFPDYSTATIVAGWWRPTTLTAARTYWGSGAGTANLMEIASTTSQVRVLVDYSTTDLTVTTTDAGITVNNWWFLAVLIHQMTSPVSVSIWRGSPTDRPTLLTTSTSGGTGTYSWGQDLMTINVKNYTTGSDVFQGQTSQFRVVNTDIATTPAASLTTMVYDRFIEPMWFGEFDVTMTLSDVLGGAMNPNVDAASIYVPLDHSSGACAYFSVKGSNASAFSPANRGRQELLTTGSALVFSDEEPPVRRVSGSVSIPRLNPTVARR